MTQRKTLEDNAVNTASINELLKLLIIIIFQNIRSWIKRFAISLFLDIYVIPQHGV